MTTITINTFAGAVSETDSLLLPAGVGVNSINQRPGFSDLRPWNSPGTTVATVPTSPQRLTVYRMGQDVTGLANYWLGWSTVVHAVSGFDAADTTERLYFTGSGTPKWTNNDIGLSGGPPYPQATRELAVPAPTDPIVAVINTNPGTGTDQAFLWVYTFVNDIGWESAPSPVSNTLVAKPGCTFDLTGFSSSPGGTYGVTKIRVYRYVPGTTTTGDYFFMREWNIGSTPANPIDDARSVGTDPIPTTGWRVPPTDGTCLTKLWNGIMAMISGKGIRLCEPFTPYAWPIAYELPLTHTGVALAVFGQRLLALTTGDAKVFVGTEPGSFDEEPTKINRPCSSVRSVVEFNEAKDVKGVAWASEEGLCWYGEDGFRMLTQGILSGDEWRALNPSTMVAARIDSLYICFYTAGSIKGFVIDTRNPSGIYYLETGYHAVFRDPRADKLIVLDGGNLKEWDEGSAMTTTFKSKLIRSPSAINIGAVEVIAKGYPATVKLWGDGTLICTLTANNDTPIRPPGGWRAEELQFEVSSTSRVIAVRAADTVQSLRSA